MFAGFLLVAVLQIALGALLLRRPPSRLIIAAAVAMTLSSIGLWVLSRTAGLPFIEGGHLEPVGFKDGDHEAARGREHPDAAAAAQPGPRPGLASVTPARRPDARGAWDACALLLVPALLLGGGTHHSHAQAVALGIHDEHDGSDAAAHGDSAAAHTRRRPRRRGARRAHARREQRRPHTRGQRDRRPSHRLLASAPLGATTSTARRARPEITRRTTRTSTAKIGIRTASTGSATARDHDHGGGTATASTRRSRRGPGGRAGGQRQLRARAERLRHEHLLCRSRSGVQSRS